MWESSPSRAIRGEKKGNGKAEEERTWYEAEERKATAQVRRGRPYSIDVAQSYLAAGADGVGEECELFGLRDGAIQREELRRVVNRQVRSSMGRTQMDLE